MEKRRSNRTRHRSTCELVIDGQRHHAVVRDLAPTGLFVQTRARPAPNSTISLRFPATAGLAGFEIEVGVARQRNVHPRLQAEVQSGIGLEILGRPADYLAYAERAFAPIRVANAAPAAPPVASATFSDEDRSQPASDRPARTVEATGDTHAGSQAGGRANRTVGRTAAAPAGGEELVERTYRVRLVAIGQSAPRTFMVRAPSAAAARAQAHLRVGGGWKVIDVQAV